jgi:hypothetical protein
MYSRLVSVPCAVAKVTLALLPLLLAVGCAQMSLGEGAAVRTHHYAGVVRVKIPATVGPVRAIDISMLGLGVENGVFVGWRRGQYVFARSEDCQLLIIIRSPMEAEHALKILRAAEGEQLCVVDFQGTLPSS